MYVCINIYIHTRLILWKYVYIYMRIIFKSYARQLSYHRICPFAHHLWFFWVKVSYLDSSSPVRFQLRLQYGSILDEACALWEATKGCQHLEGF